MRVNPLDALDERRPGPDIAHESPRESARSGRQARPRRKRRSSGVGLRWTPVLAAIAIVLAAGAGIAWMAARGGQTAALSRAGIASVWQEVATSTASAGASSHQEQAPTPYFASFRGQKLHLPVDPTAVTVLAFHQSSWADAYKLTPLVPIGDASAVKAAATAAQAAGKTLLATPAGSPAETADGTWAGSALEVWRTGRGGVQCTAVDCGAHWDTPVVSPLSGTVMRIRPYKLYGRYTDYEVQIKPDAFEDVDIFMLHVTDPLVSEGQHVAGGLTEIAKVRHLSGIVSGLQLRSYSTDGGNHTHVQLNIIPKSPQPWIVGQDPPGLVRHNGD